MRKVLAALVACVPLAAMSQDSMNHVTGLSAAGGRYAFGQVSSQRKDQYMLDTQTGRLWHMVCLKSEGVGECSHIALQSIPFADPSGAPVSYTPPPMLPAKQQP